MNIVLDASAAVEIALSSEHSQAFRAAIENADLVLAPDTYPAEVTNVFWKYGRLSHLPADTCRKGINFCLDLVDDYIGTRYLCPEVFAESMRTEHPAYDIFYLVVARRNDAVVLTRDNRMIEAAKTMGVGTAGTET